MLNLTDVHKTFIGPHGSTVSVLRGISMVVDAGSSTAILGRSGSGKSTLLAILGLLDQPDSGRYEIDGRDTIGLRDGALARIRSEQLGFVYQRFFLLSHLSAYENVETALHHGGPVPRRRRRQLVMEALSQVGLADRVTHRPVQLSGGEQQRVAIARALVRNPSIVLADEPTGALDEQTADSVMSLLMETTRSRGAAVVVVTHDAQVAARTDRVLHLVEGAWAG
ncbi:ABC transporter ATP-binding protein [Rhizomonospora bruguierae]|uniref:ABC transporter ATP-binding protein n=1 Tax=Rhizomonospora bruguierae TaxID=1581705 RepID=UPI001BCEC4CD|nr:ABC transporter ATP-binding protein [Micromonospora sp. NBRC 107566]